METAPTTEMLSVAEVCVMTGLSRVSVLREVDNDEFEAYRVGPGKKHMRITRASALAYLDRRRVIAEPASVPAAA